MAREASRPKAPWTARFVLWLVLAILYVPILVMLFSSVIVRDQGVWSVTLQWYREVFADSSLMSALGNSLLVGLCSSVFSTLLGTAAAVALERTRSRLRIAVDGMSLISLIFPELVFALALLSWFFVFNIQLGLTTVVIAHISFSLSYVMLTVRARFANFDVRLEDAARDLGAEEWTLLRTVVLPLLKPAIIGGFVLSFLLSFDDFLITYFVNGVGSDTLPVKLYTAMKTGVSPKLNALSSLMFLMTLVVLLFLFRSSAFRVLFESGGNDGSKEEKNS